MAIRTRFPSAVLFVAFGAGLTGCGEVEIPTLMEELDEAAVLEGPTAGSDTAEASVEPVEQAEETSVEPGEHAAETAHDPHWTYEAEGEEGPQHWGALSDKYRACGGVSDQSPIDLAGEMEQDMANIVFAYQPSKLTIRNNGHTVQVDYDDGSYIEIEGVRYDLKQFHFHAPSEHTIAGKPAAAELHLVHARTDDKGELKRAVVGVLIEEGAENPAFAPVWSNLPPPVTDPHVVEGQAMAADMLPAVPTTFRYIGSLTTPPCDTGILWNVMTTPIEMSAEQIGAYSAVFNGMATNRPVQALGDRSLVEDATP